MKAMESISWYAHRLKAMRPAELGHRVAEKWRKSTETGFLKRLVGAEPGPAVSAVPRLPDLAAVPEGLCQQLAEDAHALLRGEWQLFGWRQAELGSPPCWHRDAACGVVVSPEIPARQLNHRRLPDGADARTIWEINRWVEMTRLAMHAWLNNDLDALRKAQLLLEDWCDRNPPGMGINWTSPLEVALRLINFTWFDALAAAAIKRTATGSIATQLEGAQAALARRIVPVHTAWVWRYRSAGSSANNHLLGELAALVVAVSRWPELKRFACTADEAWDSLGREVLRQFAPDGGSREQALHYHAFAFELAFLAVRVVGCRAGPVFDRLDSALKFWQALGHPEEPWDFGDNDDAQVLPLTWHRALAAEEWQEWARGESGSLQFWLGECPFGLAQEEAGCRLFPQSGMAVWRTEGWMARLDSSPLGFGSLAAHGHGDALHLSLWDGDKALLIDPGTGGYYGLPQIRAELAAWEVHNGPQPVEGFLTPQRLGTFLWVKHHGQPQLAWAANGGALEKEAAPSLTGTFEHEGHLFRRVVYCAGDTVRVCDEELNGRTYRVSFTFSPECRVEPLSEAGWKITREGCEWRLEILSAGSGMQVELKDRQVSPAYGCLETAQAVILTPIEARSEIRLRRVR